MLVKSSQVDDIYNVGRLGGDEFLIVMMDCDEVRAAEFIERIKENLRRADERNKKPFRLAFSYGLVASTPAKPKLVGGLIEVANRMMYQSKQEKRKRESGVNPGSGEG